MHLLGHLIIEAVLRRQAKAVVATRLRRRVTQLVCERQARPDQRHADGLIALQDGEVASGVLRTDNRALPTSATWSQRPAARAPARLLPGTTEAPPPAREREVLALMAEGRSNEAICQQPSLTQKTVESHVRSIFDKLQLPSSRNDHRRVLAVLTYITLTH